MTVTVDSGSGFCFGVTSAIEKAEEELQHGELFCLGDIVHNGQEVERLANLGLKTIDYAEFEQLHDARVLLRAHGEPPSTYCTAKNNRIEIIDASCPVVKKLQERIRQTYMDHPHAQIAIFGKKGHAEVIGLQGQTDNRAIVLEDESDIDKLDFGQDIYLFSQTTKSLDAFHAITEAIGQRKHPNRLFCAYDTICRNVANRVDKIKAFAEANDRVVFVGGLKSSNAHVLYEHCLEANPRTYFVASDEEIDERLIGLLSSAETIGICGATSTPLWLMEKCKEKITAANPTKNKID